MDLQKISQFELRQRITLLVNRYEYFAAPADGGAKQPVVFVEQKRLKLREEITAYRSETKTEVLFSIKAEKVFDVHGRFIVRDENGNTLGYLRKVFGRSLWRSTWEIYGNDDQLLFTAQEANVALAIFRRIGSELPIIGVVVSFIPYHFEFLAPTGVVGAYRRHIGLRDHYDLSLEPPAGSIDRRLVLAFGIALDALQGR